MADWGKDKSVDLNLGLKGMLHCYYDEICHSPERSM